MVIFRNNKLFFLLNSKAYRIVGLNGRITYS